MDNNLSDLAGCLGELLPRLPWLVVLLGFVALLIASYLSTFVFR